MKTGGGSLLTSASEQRCLTEKSAIGSVEQRGLIEFSVTLHMSYICSLAVLPNMAATSHTWLPNT